MFLLPCECGKQNAVDPKLAGMEIECACGRWVAVPTLRKLRQLNEADENQILDDRPSRLPHNQGEEIPSSIRTAAPQKKGIPSSIDQTKNPLKANPPTANPPTADPSFKTPTVALLAIALIAITAVCFFFFFGPQKRTVADNNIAALVDTEEWILEMTPSLKGLGQAMKQFDVPKELFARNFDRLDIVEKPDQEEVGTRIDGALRFDWPVAKTAKTVARESAQLWQPLLENIENFEHAKFYFVKATYDSNNADSIESQVGFAGRAKRQDNSIWHVTGKAIVNWSQETSDSDSQSWKITSWKTKAISVTERREMMFREVLDQVIPAESLREQVRRSLHEERLAELLVKEPGEIDNLQFSQLELSTAEHHPGLSVVDIDGDGFDDLYVMPRWGQNVLLRNKGNGTFEDVAPALGLDIEDRCTSAVFADFDNDGDQDLMLGRSLKPSMYLINENGKFLDQSDEQIDFPLPALVYSVSAADYNRDGLLDVYFATSAVKASTDALQTILPPQSAQWLAKHLTFTDTHTILAKPGPPNILLVNRGDGKFSLAPEQDQVAIFKNTNQGTWADYDGDGDPDLYLSNDFSINTLLRNDGEAGFVDVTEQTNTADIGFGMGAAFGDFDNDLQLDIYATNMYSKAGRRITSQLDLLDNRFANMARGNSLLKNLDGEFEKVSGLTGDKLQVEKAGWSWCGQFVDVNNDGFLDVYAPNGYYTAPVEVACDVDL